jgi:hypothetical protein
MMAYPLGGIWAKNRLFADLWGESFLSGSDAANGASLPQLKTNFHAFGRLAPFTASSFLFDITIHYL